MKQFLFLAVSLLSFCATHVNAADKAAGQKVADAVCKACHGEAGNSTIADNPRIGGQPSAYLLRALKDYQSGVRKNPIMGATVATLKPADLENLAAFYAAQPGPLVTRYK